MEKIQTTLTQVVEDIKAFYNPKTHHFLTLNGVGIDAKCVEVQWIFTRYDKDEITLFYTLVQEDETIPSIASIIPSAAISQRELVDMFGITVEGSPKGLYLDEDSLQKPLSLGCAI